MKPTLIALVVVGVAASLLSLGPFSEKRSNGGLLSTAYAEGGGCSLATLQGEYLVTGQAQARLDQSDDPSYPRHSIEVYNFDGEGHMSSFFTNNNGGTIGRGTGTVVYTVDPERCSANLRFAAGFEFEWFLARDGSAGEAIRVDVDPTTGKAIVATRSMKRR